MEGGNVVVSLSERSLGRVTAADVKNPVTGEIVIKKSESLNLATLVKYCGKQKILHSKLY